MEKFRDELFESINEKFSVEEIEKGLIYSLMVVELERFRDKWLEFETELLHSHSRIMSTMITGPANFPVAKMEKINNSYSNKVNKFLEWETKAKKRIETDLGLWVSNVINSDDVDVLEKLRSKLTGLEANQVMMKSVNKIMKQKKLSVDEKRKLIIEAGASDKVMSELNFGNSGGFERFQLTNNNANMRTVQARIAGLESRLGDSTLEIKFDGGTIIDNVEENRVQIVFDEKPGEEMRGKLKSRAFRWSPRFTAWQRKRDVYGVSLRLAKEFCGVQE
jgi:hypothetical protein